MKIYIIEKSKKINSKYIYMSIFYKTVKQKCFFGLRHNSMTEMCHVLFKYENKRKIG